MHWTRLFFATLLAAITLVAWWVWRSDREEVVSPCADYTVASDPIIDPSSVDVLHALNAQSRALMEAVVPTVVSLDTTKRIRVRQPVDPLDYFFYGRRRSRIVEYRKPGLGSGVIVTEQGHILTNDHVVADVDEIRATLHDGESYVARVVGRDPAMDIAILKVDSEVPCRPLPFGDSDAVHVGEVVFAVGNPFGLNETVTRGIISAKDRRAGDRQVGLFQTDTVINPGNSGGPLVNVRGELVGINVAIAGGSQAPQSWEGVGLAIPANAVRRSFEKIMERGEVRRGFLGVNLLPLDPVTARNLGVRRGALIEAIMVGSPAQGAGLAIGDVIVQFDGEVIGGPADFIERIQARQPGDVIALKIVRGAQVREVSITLAEVPSSSEGAESPPAEDPRLAGITLRALAEEDLQNLGWGKEVQGVVVVGIESNAPAAGLLQGGDVILEVNRLVVASPEEIHRVAGRNTQALLLYLYRGGEKGFVNLGASP